MDTVTPLRVSLFSNLLNMLLDPVLMFWGGLGIAGAAVATVISEVVASGTYGLLLFRRDLMDARSLFRVPSMRRLMPLLQGGAAVQMRSFALNSAFVMATRHAQAMDSTGVSAAAYSISMLCWQLGSVLLFALQSSAAILVPAESARTGGGAKAASGVADRLLLMGFGLGVIVAAIQLLTLPLLSAFSTVPAVSRAAVTPVCIGSFMSIITGVVFAGEGVMMGRGAWVPLARLMAASCSCMVVGIQLTRRLNLGLVGIWFSIVGFNLINLVGVLHHHLVTTPRKEALEETSPSKAARGDPAGEAGGGDSFT